MLQQDNLLVFYGCQSDIFSRSVLICLLGSFLIGCKSGGEASAGPMCREQFNDEVTTLAYVATDEISSYTERRDAIQALGDRGRDYYSVGAYDYGCWQLTLNNLRELLSDNSVDIVQDAALAIGTNLSKHKLSDVIQGCIVAKYLESLRSLILIHDEPQVRRMAVIAIRQVYEAHGGYGYFGFSMACDCREIADESLRQAQEDIDEHVRRLAGAPLDIITPTFHNW